MYPLANGVTVRLGKPFVIMEMYPSYMSHPQHLWAADLQSYGVGSGKLQCWASLIPDLISNYLEAHTVAVSDDYGQTWDAERSYDAPGLHNGACYARMFDPPTGRMYEWSPVLSADPPGQAADFKFRDRAYYANGGSKYVRYPRSGALRGLPGAAELWSDLLLGVISRTTIHIITADGHPFRMADGSIGMAVNSNFGPDPQVQKWHLMLFKSTDEGATWNYSSTIIAGTNAQGGTESTMVTLSDGRLLCIFRWTGATATPVKACISTDATGTAWGAYFTPGNPVDHSANLDTAAGTFPNAHRFENGIIVLGTGQTSGNYINVCGDGALAGAASVWKRIYLTGHHDTYHNAGGTNRATSSMASGVINKYWPAETETTGNVAICHTATNRFILAYDWSPEVNREKLGSNTNHPGRIYGVHGTVEFT